MALCSMSPDTLSEVLKYLRSIDVYHLWKSGYSNMQLKLKFAARNFEICASEEMLPCPPFVLQLARLKELKVNSNFDIRLVDLTFFQHAPIEVLTLQEPMLLMRHLAPSLPCGNSSSSSSYKHYAQKEPTVRIPGKLEAKAASSAPLLKDIFPKLRKLSATNLDPDLVLFLNGSRCWESFPKTLTSLHLYGFAGDRSTSLASALPALVQLELDHFGDRLSGELFADTCALPANLISLKLSLYAYYPGFLRKLLQGPTPTTPLTPSLSSLDIRIGIDELDLLPQALTDLTLHLTSPVSSSLSVPKGSAMNFPPKLNKLSLILTLDDRHKIGPIFCASILPPSLKELCLQVPLEIQPESAEFIAYLVRLPRGLLNLVLQLEMVGDWSMESIQALPRTLTSLKLLDPMINLPGKIDWGNLFPNLRTHFCWHPHSNWTYPPSTASSIDLSRLNQDPSLVSAALKPLNALQTLSIKPQLFEVDIPASGLSSTAPIVDQVIDGISYPDQVARRVCMLAAVLPPNLEDLSLAIDLKRDPRQVCLDFGPINYFHQLRKLSIGPFPCKIRNYWSATSRKLSMSSSLPAAVEELLIQAHNVIMDELVPILPPKLTRLTVDIVDSLTDDHIARLPRGLTELTLRSLSACDFTPLGIQSLPRSLTNVHLPYSVYALQKHPLLQKSGPKLQSILPPSLVSISFPMSSSSKTEVKISRWSLNLKNKIQRQIERLNKQEKK